MKFFIVLCVLVEATFSQLVDPNYGVPIAPLQTVTLPEGPAILATPPRATTIRVVAGPVTPAILQTPVHAPLTQFVGQNFIRTVAGPVALPNPTTIPIVAGPVPFNAPFPVAGPTPLTAPVVAPAPLVLAEPAPIAAVPTSSQHHAQDEFGGFNFGYSDVNSAKEEVHTPDGVTRGSYSYVDANGVLQRVDYVADPVNGFRVAGTNIPVGPGSPVVGDAVLPAAVVDTPEVAAAKAEFQRAFSDAEAAAALAEAAESVESDE